MFRSFSFLLPPRSSSRHISGAPKSQDLSQSSNRYLTRGTLIRDLVVDGVASHEGRVLVMTTNFPDKLDEALIRPGRIDMKVAFTNATRSQICELFTRMYSPDTPADSIPGKLKLSPVPSAVKHVEGQTSMDSTLLQAKPTSPENLLTPPQSPLQSSTPVTPSTPADVESIAIQFADRLPEDKFTPAEIQVRVLGVYTPILSRHSSRKTPSRSRSPFWASFTRLAYA